MAIVKLVDGKYEFSASGMRFRQNPKSPELNAAWLSCKVFRRLTFGQRVAVVSSSGRVWVFA